MKKNNLLVGVFIFACFLILTPYNAEAETYFYNMNDLIDEMREAKKVDQLGVNANFAKANLFLGYVLGVVDTLSSSEDPPPLEGVSIQQILAIVINYVEKNPTEWNKPASWAVENALTEAFPKPKPAK